MTPDSVIELWCARPGFAGPTPTLQQSALCQVAELHRASLPGGFISILGPQFLGVMYEGISRAPGSCLILARGPGGVIDGFLAGTASSAAMFRWILPRYGLRLVWYLISHLACPATLRRVAETFLYMVRGGGRRTTVPIRSQTGSPGELLSIAVALPCRGLGLGRLMVAEFEAFLRTGYCTCYRVVTHQHDARANSFYISAGFSLVRHFLHHGLQMNEYEKSLHQCP